MTENKQYEMVRGILQNTCGAIVESWLLDEAAQQIVDETGMTDIREALEAVEASIVWNDYFTITYQIGRHERQLINAALSKAKGE